MRKLMKALGYVHKDDIPRQPYDSIWLNFDQEDMTEYGRECAQRDRIELVEHILDLCNRFDVWPIDEERINMGVDKKARSQRWESYAKEQGGLFDMLDNIKADYLAKMGKVQPGDAKTLEALAIGARVTEALRSEVRSVIAAGEIEARNEDRAAKFSVVPARKSV